MGKHYKTRVREDHLAAGFDHFKSECLAARAMASLDERDAWAAYVGFIDRIAAAGVQFARTGKMGRRAFTATMAAGQWERERSNGRRVWRGLALSPAGAADRLSGLDILAFEKEMRS